MPAPENQKSFEGKAGILPGAIKATGGTLSHGLSTRSRRWGVILAGGEGTRLHSLTQLICGDDRPKQYCPLVGHETLLEQTRIRAERSIPWRQMLFALTRAHRSYYLQEPGVRPSQRIVQPADKGTAPPVVHSLLSIEQNDPEAIVAILPSDNYYSKGSAFTASLESAFAVAAENTGSVVLLGAQPHSPEREYGWIEVGPRVVPSSHGSFHIRNIYEKLSFPIAQHLLARGALWNTFVMVGHVRGFLQMVRTALPATRAGGLAAQLGSAPLWAGSEVHLDNALFQGIHPVDFSRDFLAAHTRNLIVLPLRSCGWSDLGRPERVIDIVQGAASKPWWLNEWLMAKPPARETALFASARARGDIGTCA